MELADYFADIEGLGVLATGDNEGNVDVAVYSRPYVIDQETVAFSMQERLSLANLEKNPKAAYLFVEKGPGYKGTRLYLVKTGEETDPDRIQEIRCKYSRKSHSPDEVPKHFVYFKVTKIRPLVGDQKTDE